jgi:hypothetical protein
MKTDRKSLSLAVAPSFPARWTRVLDETIPSFVKERFSPSESWKKKPFSKEDVRFFSKGLMELSGFFTTERTGEKLPDYFTTARFRSSYFLYFFGLQGAKFLTLYDRHPEAVGAVLEHANRTGTLRIVDVGSGPGTASLALLCFLLEGLLDPRRPKLRLPFKIELHWIDHNEAILKDGEALLAGLLELFPEIDGDVSLKKERRSWWKHPRDFDFSASLVLFGNVLNECSDDPRIFLEGLAPFLKEPQGGGVLLVEPAFKEASQRLSRIRDEAVLADSPLPLWGPCLHSGKCPLAEGRNWCHFSVPATLPGSFFRKFSIRLGGIRDWLKFSFVWIGSRDSAPQMKLPKGLVRVVSDPVRTPRGLQSLVCRPERFTYEKCGARTFRGEVVDDPLLQPRHKKN